MELDKRIRSIVDILTVINSDMGGIIGKTGYFGNSIMDFKRLDTCEYGELTGIIRNTDRCFEYENCAESGRKGYCYFIPECYLNPVEPEKKYRAFSLAEWIDQHEIGDVINYKDKSGGMVAHHMYMGYAHGIDKNIKDVGVGVITLGVASYDLDYLFKEYEIEVNGKWQPFGIIDEGKE